MKHSAIFMAILLLLTGLLLQGGIIIPTALAQDGGKILPGEGTKISLPDGNYFKYSFNKRPSLGTVILKVKVFDNKDKQIRPYTIYGESGMPSMPGHHDSGKQSFKLNKKGDYLLPVDVVMPGVWEVKVQVHKGKQHVFTGRIQFEL